MRGVAVCVLGIALLVGCGGSEEPEEPEPPALADVVPPDATLYGEFVLRPAGREGRALRRFAGTLLGLGTADTNDLAELAVEALDAGIDFERDVAPWLGERAGFFISEDGVGEAQGALVLETRDPRRAARGLQRAAGMEGDLERFPGGKLWETSGDGVAGVVNGRAIVADSEPAFRACARAADGESLSGTKRYRAASAPIKGRRPTSFVVAGRGESFGDLLRFIRLPPGQRRLLRAAIDPDEALTFRADVTATDAVLEILGARTPGLPAEPIDDVPAASWLALSSGDLGESLTQGLAGGRAADALRVASLMPFPQRMLSELGRGSLYLQGGLGRAGSDGEIEAEVQDYDVAARGVKALARRLRASPLFDVELHTSREQMGLSMEPKRYPSLVDALDVTLLPREMTVVFGATGSAHALGETAVYRRARRVLGGAPTMLLRIPQYARAMGAPGVFGYAERIDLVAARAERLPGGRHRQRLMIGLNPDVPPPDSPDGQDPPTEPASAPARASPNPAL
jgi:hypothetical protein